MPPSNSYNHPRAALALICKSLASVYGLANLKRFRLKKNVTERATLMNQLVYDRLVRTSLTQPGRLLESEAEHDRILKFISAKDGYSAERVTRDGMATGIAGGRSTGDDGGGVRLRDAGARGASDGAGADSEAV